METDAEMRRVWTRTYEVRVAEKRRLSSGRIEQRVSEHLGVVGDDAEAKIVMTTNRERVTPRELPKSIIDHLVPRRVVKVEQIEPADDHPNRLTIEMRIHGNWRREPGGSDEK